ncbi:radical SAM protein [Candidatus Bathyarchaeota archaeon]|nr:radical SAM protein [Candidatus Bathyarchaeota archaeon]
MTNIYHIVRYTYDNSIYVHFQGCNFRCKGCLLKQTIWDCHLTDDVQRRLQAIKDFRQLSLSEFKTVVKKLNVKIAILGGGEPTLDEELPDVIDLLNGLDIETRLLTNGHILNEKFIEKLEEVELSNTCISIKAHDDSIHRFYTGQTNKSVLDNFKLLAKSRIKLMVESVLIPGLIEPDEIERIARFIASINPSIPFRIDGFIPIHDVPWRRSSPKEVIRATQIAKRYLENVYYIHSDTEQKGQAINVYPIIKDDNLVPHH